MHRRKKKQLEFGENNKGFLGDDTDSVSREKWQRKLWFTGIDNSTRQNIIALENKFVDEHSKRSKDFVGDLLKDHKSHGRISGEDVMKAIVESFEEFGDENKKQLKYYIDRIHNTGRVNALEGIGLSKKTARSKIAAAADERRENVLQSIDLAFRSVTSLPDRIVEQLRERLMSSISSGSTTQEVLRGLLQNQIDDLDLEQEGDLREALSRIWGRTRNDLQRVIRTETVNAYSRVQLQEWFDQGIKQVTRHSIDDDKTCAVCRSLSAPPDNVYNISDLLALDYPVTQDPRTGGWLTHPNCRCTPNKYAKVYTIKGWQAIGEIKKGDLVLTHRGRFRKVTEIKNQHYWEAGTPFTEITVKHAWREGKRGSRKVKLVVTPDHPFMTSSGWKLAYKLSRKDDLIVLARKCEYCGKKYPWYAFADNARFCSQSCSSKHAAQMMWKDPERHKMQSIRGKEQMKREDRKNKWAKEKIAALTANANVVTREMVKKGKHQWQKNNRTFIPWMHKPGPKRDEICAKISKIKIETGQNARASAANQGTISAGQRKLYGCIKKIYDGAELNYPIQPVKGRRSYVLDIAIPEYKICVEYDGLYWHQDKEKDKRRDNVLSEHGWVTFRVPEGDSFDPVVDQVKRLISNHTGNYSFMEVLIENIEIKSRKKRTRLWNLEVEDDHSYIMEGVVSHNCWFEPVVADVWAELEGMEADLFGDINRKGTVALDVPIDDRSHVETMLREMDENISMKFVPKIEDLPEWREWELIKLRDRASGDVAEMILEEEILLNGNTEWTDPQTEIHYIAQGSKKIDHITMPMARAQAKVKYDKYDVKFVVDRFLEKKSEVGMTLEDEGIEIFGGEPFINPSASNSPKDYFIESYAYYIVNPIILRQVDNEMYEWLNNEIFHGREYIRRGGIK